MRKRNEHSGHDAESGPLSTWCATMNVVAHPYPGEFQRVFNPVEATRRWWSTFVCGNSGETECRRGLHRPRRAQLTRPGAFPRCIARPSRDPLSRIDARCACSGTGDIAARCAGRRSVWSTLEIPHYAAAPAVAWPRPSAYPHCYPDKPADNRTNPGMARYECVERRQGA